MHNEKTLTQWLEYQQQVHPSEIALGLTRVRTVAKALGILSIAPKIITVAGTNGKGSTVAFIDQLLRASGLRTGVYTSPHLLRYTERIRLSGKEILEQELCDHFAAIDAARGQTPLTYFEFGTLAAVFAFVQHKVDIVVLEVGLGGRLDASNVWDADVAVVTSIALDHSDWLGDDLAQIGREKAGIFRLGKPAILGENLPASVAAYGDEVGAQVLQFSIDFKSQVSVDSWDWQIDDRIFSALPLPKMPGKFQRHNAACALAAVSQLVPLQTQAIHQAMAQTVVAGRLQTIEYQGVACVLDVAHNVHAAQALAAHLRTRAKPVVAIFAMMHDKEIQAVAKTMHAVVSSWAVFDLAMPRAATKEQLAEIVASDGVLVQTCDNVQEAVTVAVNKAKTENTEVLVFGSFFTVAAFLQTIGQDHVAYD